VAEVATGPGRLSRLRNVRWHDVFQLQTLIVVGSLLLVGYFALVPLTRLLYGTFYDGQSLTLRFFSDAYDQYRIGEMITNSIVFAVGSTILAVSVGTSLAYINVRTDVPFKGLIFAASLVPLIIPGILHTIAWIFLASPRIGFVNEFLEPIIGPATFNIFSMAGMIFIEGLHLSPLVFLLMVAAFKSMDPSLEESALASGARLTTVIRRVTLPLVKPALFAAVLIMMVRGLEAFEVPALVGRPAGVWVFTSRIYRALNTYPIEYGNAGALATSLLVLTSIGVFLQSRFSRTGKRYQTVTGKGFRPRPMELGKWRRPITIAVFVYFFVAVVLPVMMLLYMSTQNFYRSPSLESLSDMTLDNYRYTFTNSQSVRALKNSFMLGVGTATVVMLVMAVVAWVVVRTKVRGRWLVDNLAFLPLTIPGLVLGVALIFVYLRVPLPIYGTLWILFIAYFTRYMPYGMRYATTSMYQISGELEESAKVSGANWWQSFRRVLLPLLVPGLVAGWIYIVTVSVRELSSSILLYSPGNEVLSILIFQQWENGQTNELAALGVIMVAALVLLVAIASRLGARIGVREAH
jgi:iron(III) transport system permease protein